VIDKKVRIPSSVPQTDLCGRVLPRLAITGIYLVRGVPAIFSGGACARRARGTTLRWVLLQALGDYAAGTWTRNEITRCPRSAIGRLTSTRFRCDRRRVGDHDATAVGPPGREASPSTKPRPPRALRRCRASASSIE
jgi:hypothetical protein